MERGKENSSLHQAVERTKVIYMVDIDGTICITPTSDKGSPEYTKSVPIQKRIDYFNRLYDQGHTINYWTARGSSSGIDWSDFTKKQLESWGVKSHSVSVGKPSYDIWVDDKAVNASNIRNMAGYHEQEIRSGGDH